MADPTQGGISSQLQSHLAQQTQQQANKTGAHEMWIRGKPSHGVQTAHLGAWGNSLMPKPFGMPKFGGGINKNAKQVDIKKSGYAPAPGQAEHVNPQLTQPQQNSAQTPPPSNSEGDKKATHVDLSKAEHINRQFAHLKQMGIGGEQQHPAFMGLNPFVGMANPFMGMNPWQGRLSPLGTPNMGTVTGTFAAQSQNYSANISHQVQSSIAAAQAAQAAQAAASRGRA